MKMKNSYIFSLVFCLFLSNKVFSQKVFFFADDYIPNSIDSNMVCIHFSNSIFSFENKSPYTKKSTQSSPHLTRLEFVNLEYLIFLSNKFNSRFHPHFLVSMNVVPAGSSYLGSYLGFGISDSKLKYSFGLIGGSFFRRVPEFGNFRTRKNNFNYGSVFGFYLQSKTKYTNIHMLFCLEDGGTEYEHVRVAFRVGQLLGKKSFLKSFELVAVEQDFVGRGFGVSFSPLKRFGLELIHTSPHTDDMITNSRINNPTFEGVLITFSVYVD